MEREKRKKVTAEERGGGVVEETKKKKTKKKKMRETVEVEEPTTEEVEEFYAILKRMDVAMRYLKEAQNRLTERKPAAETAVEVGEKIELNLNEMPADSGD